MSLPGKTASMKPPGNLMCRQTLTKHSVLSFPLRQVFGDKLQTQKERTKEPREILGASEVPRLMPLQRRGARNGRLDTLRYSASGC